MIGPSSSFERSHGIWAPSDKIHDTLIQNGPPAVILVSAPMGGNKSRTNTTVVDFFEPYDLTHFNLERKFSVSKTTRDPRLGEIDGVHYDFNCDPDEITDGYANGTLLECDHHGGESYGTPMPHPNEPLLVEIEVRGFYTALANPHPNADYFRKKVHGIYIVQQSMKQLIGQILDRPGDTMPEQKKIARACRYPGELDFLLRHALPYTCIENMDGDIEYAPIAAVRVLAGDESAPVLDKQAVQERIEDACDYLRDNDLEPVWVSEDHTK